MCYEKAAWEHGCSRTFRCETGRTAEDTTPIILDYHANGTDLARAFVLWYIRRQQLF